MFIKNTKAHSLGCRENCSICYRAPDGCGQTDHGSYISGPLTGQRASNDSAQAVTDQMDFSSGLIESFVESLIESSLDQQIGTFGIDSDPGKVRAISDTLKPGVQLCEVNIRAKKAGDEDHRRPIAAWNAQSVINGGRVQDQYLGAEQRFSPERSVRLQISMW